MDDHESFKNMTVPQLKKFLVERGVPCTGKRRRELENLAEKAAKVYPVLEECDHEASERKRRRVSTADGSVRDLNGKAVAWTRDLKHLPPVHISDVYAYLLTDCGWTYERIKKHFDFQIW